MGKAAFASLAIAKLKATIGLDGGVYAADTADKAQAAVAEAITEYLTANTTINISYSGVLTSGTGTDPVVTDSMKIMGVCGKIGKPSDFADWTNRLQVAIASSFSVATPGGNGVITMFKPFSPTANALQIVQKDLHNAHQNNISRPAQAVWEVICEGILSWLNSSAGRNPMATGLSATRPGVSEGVASLVSITVL